MKFLGEARHSEVTFIIIISLYLRVNLNCGDDLMMLLGHRGRTFKKIQEKGRGKRRDEKRVRTS